MLADFRVAEVTCSRSLQLCHCNLIFVNSGMLFCDYQARDWRITLAIDDDKAGRSDRPATQTRDSR
jgi:hypothetical protein